jgi:hypothetical protein
MAALAGFVPVSISLVAERHAMCVGWTSRVNAVILCVLVFWTSQIPDSQGNTMGEQEQHTCFHRPPSFGGGALHMGPLFSMLVLLQTACVRDDIRPVRISCGAICPTLSGASRPTFMAAIGPFCGDTCAASPTWESPSSCAYDPCLLCFANPQNL